MTNLIYDNLYDDNLTLKNSNEQEILEITIDRTLTFHQHIEEMCRIAGQKLSVLLRLSPFLALLMKLKIRF